ncbi:ATP-binding cassette domain-containing protein [Actinosynnema sp. NPDC047251]|uniref:ABC-type transporter, ATPase subunit n=1 Tax=Saccharothrix espanaensis (strain ATCC 51144 / DSM 44229 / JCM 9112 / NBRC 15066 / NRRL 15764) TaxID=1179773 RepID=K0K0P3_SACES|nr:ABC-type transporter, ATPase subunit [Saccharothrix espanaensis DSM 44229]
MTAFEVRDLVVGYGRGARRVRAVRGVGFAVPAGTTLGLLGESGSGKSTIARVAVGLEQATSGDVLVDGESVLGPAGRRARSRVQMVFQDPYSSLDPRMTVGRSIAEGVHAGRRQPKVDGSLPDDPAGLLELVGLDPSFARRLPHQLSGGQRQRVALARALGARPAVLLADEITSALDVSVQGTVLNLFRRIQRDLGLSSVFISHNLAVVRYVCDQVAVLDRGELVEMGPVEKVLSEPEHPATRALVAAVPQIGVPLFTRV